MYNTKNDLDQYDILTICVLNKSNNNKKNTTYLFYFVFVIEFTVVMISSIFHLKHW